MFPWSIESTCMPPDTSIAIVVMTCGCWEPYIIVSECGDTVEQYSRRTGYSVSHLFMLTEVSLYGVMKQRGPVFCPKHRKAVTVVGVQAGTWWPGYVTQATI